MSRITDPLILPADVRLVPVIELAEEVRQHLEWEEGDVAISRLRSRIPSKVIDAQTAALVEQFRSPKKMVEAIIRYSLANGADPRETLQNAFPVLQQLIAAKLLVLADSTDAEQVDLTLHAGDQVDRFSIVYPVHLLEDTELYQARADDGTTVALKIARPDVGPRIARMLAAEAAVLRLLEGAVSPVLFTTGEHQERTYLAMSWCEGVPATAAANELQRAPTPASQIALLNLCIAILGSYARLHARGVIHGDIHPNNILVDSSGTVRLIDFGLARTHNPAPGLTEPYRGGVAFFYEPEYAEAARAGKQPPPATEAGEQYGLAALLYHLLTGKYYLDFSLEQDEMLRQIAEDPPLPFARQGLEAWPAVEQVLTRALSKSPADRYLDVAAFAAELSAVVEALEVGTQPAEAPPQADATAEAFLADILGRVGWKGEAFVNGLPRQPDASVQVGAAGIAYVLYRLACCRDDAALLALADAWAARAARCVGDEASFYNPDIELTPETVGRISPYHTPTGIFATQALIAQARGDRVAEEVAIRQFVAAADQPCDNLDVTLGKSGLLVAGALLYEALSDQAAADETGLLALGNTTMAEIWETLDGYPPIREAHQLTNLGIAHGWGGILYATLRWCATTGAALPSNIEGRLHQLAALAEHVGRGVRWLWQLDQPGTYMPGWCNGSAGYVFLWMLAYKVLHDPVYRSLAEKATWNCWEDQAQIASLCCGLTGRAYALLHWYKHTGDDVWFRRAVALANQAAINIRAYRAEEEKGFENSLYKGELGVAALLIDLENPEGAALPFFESEGWPLS